MTKSGNYHHGDLREAMVREALRDLESNPAHELSVRDIAQRLGVSKAAPYRHFPTRSDFLVAARTEGFERFLTALTSVPTSPTDPFGTLARIGEAYVGFAGRNPFLYRLLFSGEGLSLADPAPDAAGRKCFEVLVAATRAAQEAGWRVEDDPLWLASALWAHVHGVAMLRLEGLLVAPKGREEEFWRSLAGAAAPR